MAKTVDTMATAIDADNLAGLELEYGVDPEASGLGLPAIQATNFQPATIPKSVIPRMGADEYVQVGDTYFDRSFMALGDKAFELLDPQQAARLGATEKRDRPIKKADECLFYVLPESVRYVVLVQPRKYVRDRKTKENIRPLGKGDRLKEMGLETVVKLLIALVVDDAPILDGDGRVQVFTLKLNSTKTNLVSDYRNKEAKSIESLAEKLKERYKTSKWLTHLVSLSIVVTPQQFKNAEGETSEGIIFELSGNAKALNKEAQKAIAVLVSSEYFKAIAADPFGLKTAAASAIEAEVEEDTAAILAEMPF
jgi:hypothetical protein